MIALGHAFVQNLRRGHYELAIDVSPPLRPAAAFRELALAMRPPLLLTRRLPRRAQRNRPPARSRPCGSIIIGRAAASGTSRRSTPMGGLWYSGQLPFLL